MSIHRIIKSMKYDPVQLVELFHLIFLDQLGRKLVLAISWIK